MSKKRILNPTIVREKLEKDGIIFGLEGDDAKEYCLDKWDASFDTTSSWAEGHEDIIIYSETTADDYEVWVCTDNHRGNLNINEDVYYYQGNEQFMERALEALRYGGSVWIDSYMAEDMEYDICDAFTMAYEDEYEGLFENMKDELLNTEYDEWEKPEDE